MSSTNKKGAKSRWEKGFASLFVIYHLTAIAVGPSPMGHLHQVFLPIYRLYWSAFDLGSTWSFFAPEPGSPPLFFEWEMEGKNGERTTGRFPEYPSPYWNRERQTLRMSIASYLFMHEHAGERALAPYLCRIYPEAVSVSLWRTLYGVPPLEPYARGESKLGLHTPPVRRWISHSFCEAEKARAQR
jgi:hypothetical protein